MGDRVTTLFSLCENEVVVEKEQKLEAIDVAEKLKSKEKDKDQQNVLG